MEMLEINPLIITDGGDLKALDAKIGFDGNAVYRHADIAELRDTTEEDARELEASKYDLNYIALDGEIGCMVNGGGVWLWPRWTLSNSMALNRRTSWMSAAAPQRKK